MELVVHQSLSRHIFSISTDIWKGLDFSHHACIMITPIKQSLSINNLLSNLLTCLYFHSFNSVFRVSFDETWQFFGGRYITLYFIFAWWYSLHVACKGNDIKISPNFFKNVFKKISLHACNTTIMFSWGTYHGMFSKNYSLNGNLVRKIFKLRKKLIELIGIRPLSQI